MKLESRFQKVVTVPQGKGNDRVFILGGASDEEGSEAIADCFELDHKGKKASLKEIAPLPTP